MIASLAELSRTPFDMPVADSEIIFGAYTEYRGLKFAFFLLAEYGGIVALSGVAAVLFLGRLPGACPASRCPAPIWMAGKIGALSFFVIWLRATYPAAARGPAAALRVAHADPHLARVDPGRGLLQGRVLRRRETDPVAIDTNRAQGPA